MHKLLLSLLLISTTVFADSSIPLSDWKPYAARESLMPKDSVATEHHTLWMSANGNESMNASWRATVPVKGGEYYRFYAEYKAKDVPLPRRSVLASIDWQDEKGNRLDQPEFPALQDQPIGEWRVLAGIFPAPKEATVGQIDLIFRWSKTGSVEWRNISLTPSEAPQPRLVKVATVNYRSRNSSGPQENLERYGKYVEQAGEQGADIVCLPEGITVVGVNKKYHEVGEPIPGPSTEFLGKLAKKYSMYIVAGIYEYEGETLYNTSVLIDREGKVAGSYRKASLPREEIEGGITPGNDYPVFQTDFGKVGMMICWDVQFVEPARCLANAGAEIVFLPIWGGNETLFAARAIENQVYLVSSSYDAKTGIWDRTGTLVSEAKTDGSITVHTIDLNQRTLWPWLGDFRARISREAPVVQGE